MKPKLSIWLALLISFILVVFGLVYGDVSGYADERAQVSALLDGDSGLMTVVGYRASDGLNLCVVAERHLTGDTEVAALRETAENLRADGQSLRAVKAEEDALTAAFHSVIAKLNAIPNVAQSGRDAQYLAMLTADFEQYGRHEIYAAYNKAATAFNQKLNTPALGNVARFFGVAPCELYE
ncbi:MAG: hypothetical protein LLF96_00810 [Eubacteriales bacterium]|nr:hypothetical protein [Eubacteriales bacterium]